MSIASGPTVLSPSDQAAALAVVDQYGLREQLPPPVLYALLHGTGPLNSETPVVENRLIGSNRQAQEAAAGRGGRAGLRGHLGGRRLAGRGARGRPAVCAAGEHAAGAAAAGRHRALAGRAAGACFVAGGETTVTVRGRGLGGRNQEAALAAATVIAGLATIAIGTFATDGVDGPTDAAGAIVTGETIPRARENGMDPERYLDNNDSYSFFSAAGGLVVTGPTGTNVNDLWFGMVY